MLCCLFISHCSCSLLCGISCHLLSLGALSRVNLGRRPVQVLETISGQFWQEDLESWTPGGRSRKMGNMSNKWSCTMYHWPLASSLTVRSTAGRGIIWARQEAPAPGTKSSNKYGPVQYLLSQMSTVCIISKPSKVQRVKTWTETNLLYETHLTVQNVLLVFANANM